MMNIWSMPRLASFRSADDGAISVDFVVLTAAIFLTGAVVVGTFDQEVVRIADDTGDFIARQLDE